MKIKLGKLLFGIVFLVGVATKSDAQTQHTLSLGLTNVRPQSGGGANFAGITLDYQLQFKPKLPSLFLGATAAHFPAGDFEMGKRLFVHDPFGKFPMSQIGAVFVGLRQDLPQKGKVQPYLELGGGAYYFLQRFGIPPPSGNLSDTYHKVAIGMVGGTGLRFLVSNRFSMCVMTRGHLINPGRWPVAYSYFEWAGFLSYRFGS